MKKNKHLKELKLVFPSNSKKLKHCNLNLFFDGDELGQFSACLGVLYPELFGLKQLVGLDCKLAFSISRNGPYQI